jgi:hypothetical protein
MADGTSATCNSISLGVMDCRRKFPDAKYNTEAICICMFPIHSRHKDNVCECTYVNRTPKEAIFNIFLWIIISQCTSKINTVREEIRCRCNKILKN